MDKNEQWEKDMKYIESQKPEDRLVTAFIMGTNHYFRHGRILGWAMIVLTFAYFLYLLYTGKSLLNMLPLIIPLMCFPAPVMFSDLIFRDLLEEERKKKYRSR